MTSTATIPEILNIPRRAFFFNTSAHLLRITRQKATNLVELLRAVRECPEDSIFQHTFRTLQEHHFIREGFSNDFAHWALTDCNEPGLAERLAGVDIREFTSLEDLRQRFIQLLDDYLKNNPKIAERPALDVFYFCAADVVIMPTSLVANNLGEFAEGLRKISVHSIHHHFIEARLRLKLSSNDFSQWLLDDMGLIDVARAINRIDIYTVTMEDVRQQMVKIVERALM